MIEILNGCFFARFKRDLINRAINWL
ncbi:hypothetical protein CTRU02_205557 [Colletotrichum truncatum]|uniref:Uncharacterized protein n=1 Tax=Colletotrichum truncatum TaxID=5467 RepID=A0ACC3Z4B7_COLTU